MTPEIKRIIEDHAKLGAKHLGWDIPSEQYDFSIEFAERGFRLGIEEAAKRLDAIELGLQMSGPLSISKVLSEASKWIRALLKEDK